MNPQPLPSMTRTLAKVNEAFDTIASGPAGDTPEGVAAMEALVAAARDRCDQDGGD